MGSVFAFQVLAMKTSAEACMALQVGIWNMGGQGVDSDPTKCFVKRDRQ